MAATNANSPCHFIFCCRSVKSMSQPDRTASIAKSSTTPFKKNECATASGRRRTTTTTVQVARNFARTRNDRLCPETWFIVLIRLFASALVPGFQSTIKNHQSTIFLLLAFRAVVAAASRDNDPLDRSLARQAWLAFAPIHAVPKLEETFLPIGVHVIGDR